MFKQLLADVQDQVEKHLFDLFFQTLIWTSQLPRLVVVLAIFLFLWGAVRDLIWRRNGKPIPSVQNGLPFFGQVFTMLKGSPWDTMAAWALEYGTFYKLHLFGKDSYVVSDPTLLKVVLNSRLSVFKKDLEWTYKPFLVILGNGLVTADGSSWRKQRNLLSHHLRIDILDEIPRITFGAVARFKQKLDKIKRDGTTLEMAEEFRHLTLQVISEAILSLSAKESDETFAHMYLPIVEEGNLRTWSPQRMFLPTPSWFRFRAAVKTLDDYVSGLIKRRWALRLIERSKPAGRRPDVLDKVLSAIGEDEWGPAAIKQVCEEVKTFILAGHETSASMLAWSLYELTKNPHCLERVRAEAHAVFGNGRSLTDIPARGELDALRYTECCLRESLRKYSVVPSVVRVASEAIEMEGYYIEKGATIMINIQGTHHDPQFWPEPLVYKPERFLSPDTIQPYTFIPFVEGPRMCLGQFLSLLETKTVLAYLVYNYTFEVVNKDTAGLKHPFMVPIIPKVGHFMKVH